MKPAKHDMVWIIAMDSHGASGVVHCEVVGVHQNVNLITYDLVLKDNPDWEGERSFLVEEEAIYNSLSKAISCLEITEKA